MGVQFLQFNPGHTHCQADWINRKVLQRPYLFILPIPIEVGDSQNQKIAHKLKKVVRRPEPGTTFSFFNQEERLLKLLAAGGSDPAGQFLLLVILDLGQNVHPRGDILAGAIGIPDGAEWHGF